MIGKRPFLTIAAIATAITLGGLLVAALIVDPGSAETPLAPIVDPSAAEVQTAFDTARRLIEAQGMASPPWAVMPDTVVIQRIPEVRLEGPGQRLLGRYQMSRGLDSFGVFWIEERIELYLPDEDRCWLQPVLVHEILHSIHARLGFLDAAALLVAPEEFVRYFQGDPDLRPCSEKN